MFDTKQITEWERNINESLNPKGYQLIVGLISNAEEDKCSVFIAKLDAEKPKSFYSPDLPEGVWRLSHSTFEGALPMVERQLKELNIS